MIKLILKFTIKDGFYTNKFFLVHFGRIFFIDTFNVGGLNQGKFLNGEDFFNKKTNKMDEFMCIHDVFCRFNE
jgi:hypothetical protein